MVGGLKRWGKSDNSGWEEFIGGEGGIQRRGDGKYCRVKSAPPIFF